MEISKEIIFIFLNIVFVNNFIFAKSIGLCPYIGVSRHFRPAVGMGMAVTFVMTMSSAATWLVYRYILIPFHIEYLYIIAFILVIASLVQLLEMVIEKTAPILHRALGIYLPLITTNCAVLAITVLNKNMFFTNSGQAVPWSFIKAIVNGFGGGVGFAIALLLMSGIRERLDFAEVPEAMKEVPIAFIVAGISSLAFMGFL